MPRVPQPKRTAAHQKLAEENEKSGPSVYDMEDEPLITSPVSPSRSNETPIIPKNKKRVYGQDEEGKQDFGSEVQDLLKCFGADISKTVMAKRKRLETFTNASLKASNKKVDEIWKEQHTERNKLNDEYKRQLSSVLAQWDSDLDKSKEQEEKLQNLFRQQQKMFQQARVVQNQRLKTIRQLHEQYMKGVDELGKCHDNQHSNVQQELKKEMALLQKKILMDTGWNSNTLQRRRR
ncbi:unnamed protein product [Owenia fusiformis]|uniref:Uncharacterized protein n=1 Tax=Owenia fusiformis TaxID=6347 RepID=A0A8J1V0Z4_OWEFU|nr:unnamed protein product [Owenia fusiformis]